MGTTPPGWLLPAWMRSCKAVGATASPEAIEAAGQTLLDRWQSPERDHHNWRHLVAVLARADELVGEAHAPELVRLAVWFHSAVMEPVRHGTATCYTTNEQDSATLAFQQLTALGISEKNAQRVHDLVMALDSHNPDPNDLDAAVLSDADLGILAADPQEYKAFVAKVRLQYCDVPVAQFLTIRRTILAKLLGRRQIFLSPMAQCWEEQARDNLEAEMRRITKELASLPPSELEWDQTVDIAGLSTSP